MREPEILWRPDPARIPATNIDRFRRSAEKATSRALLDYEDLYRCSIEQPEEFWGELWRFLDIVSSRDWDTSITAAGRMRETKFYAGAKLNFAENMLRHQDKDVAVTYYDETGHRFAWSTRELREQVAATAAGLRQAGVTAGDRVAGFVPNHPFALVAMLAASSIGAIWSSCSPDFGNNGIIDRFGQIAPKVLFSADGYRYNGKTFDSVASVAEFLPQLPSIERVVVFPNLENDVQLLT